MTIPSREELVDQIQETKDRLNGLDNGGVSESVERHRLCRMLRLLLERVYRLAE